jgi:hypothetical protein
MEYPSSVTGVSARRPVPADVGQGDRPEHNAHIATAALNAEDRARPQTLANRTLPAVSS